MKGDCMNDKIQAFLLGFTNAFRPVDYSEIYGVGEISKRIDRKILKHRKLTRGKINEITAKRSQPKIARSAEY